MTLSQKPLFLMWKRNNLIIKTLSDLYLLSIYVDIYVYMYVHICIFFVYICVFMFSLLFGIENDVIIFTITHIVSLLYVIWLSYIIVSWISIFVYMYIYIYIYVEGEATLSCTNILLYIFGDKWPHHETVPFYSFFYLHLEVI